MTTIADSPIYFDYASSAPMHPEVLRAMEPYFLENFGNASSGTHKFGWKAKAGVNSARKKIATHIGAEEGEVYFTSGATESISTFHRGVFDRYKKVGNHIISCKTEHKSVLNNLSFLENLGAEITYLQPDENGLISLQELENAIRPNTILISLMWINNETGCVQDVHAIGEIAKKNKVLFFCDATQALEKKTIDVKRNNISALALSAHKIGGPKGIGLLYLSRKKPRVNINPLLLGGGQEKGIRGGTLNTPGIIGFEKAIELIQLTDNDRIKKLNNLLCEFFISKGMSIVGDQKNRCPHILNVLSNKTEAFKLIKKNTQFAFSLGSACTSENITPSHVLTALSYSDEKIKQAFRISIGWKTTEEEVQKFIQDFQF